MPRKRDDRSFHIFAPCPRLKPQFNSRAITPASYVLIQKRNTVHEPETKLK